MTRTQPRMTPLALFGVALVVASIAVIVVDFTAPWVDVADSDETLDREEFSDMMDFDYWDALTSWPLMAAIFGIIAGVLLVAVDLIPNVLLVQRILQALLLVFAIIGMYLLFLAGVRMFGTYLNSLMDEGPVDSHVHVPTYLHMAIGGGLGAWATIQLLRTTRDLMALGHGASRMIGSMRAPALMVLVAAGTLVALPLLPHAWSDADETVEEAGLAALAEVDTDGLSGDLEDLATAAGNLGIARGMLWTVLWISLGTLAILMLERIARPQAVWAGLAQVHLLTGIPILIAVIFTIIAYAKLFGIEDVDPGYNYFHFIGQLALGAAYALFVVKVSLPFFREMNARSAAAAAAGHAAGYGPVPVPPTPAMPPAGYAPPRSYGAPAVQRQPPTPAYGQPAAPPTPTAPARTDVRLQCPRCGTQVPAPSYRPAQVQCPGCGFQANLTA